MVAQSLADLSDYLAPSQLCIKPVTLVEDTSEDTPFEGNNLLTRDISQAAVSSGAYLTCPGRD